MKEPEQIQKEIEEYGKVALWGCRKEIRNLSRKLDEDERIIGLLRVFTSATIGLLVATSRRLVLMDNHAFYGTDHKDFSYLQISAVDYNTRLFFGKISVEDQAGHCDEFDYALIKDLRKFVNVVSLKVAQVREHLGKPGGHGHGDRGGGGMSVAEELEKLWQLVERGALSKEEYDQRKARLLGS